MTSASLHVRLQARIELAAHRDAASRRRTQPARPLRATPGILHERAAPIDDERGAVEDELVLAADAIDVTRSQAILAARAHSTCYAAQRLLLHVVRRSVRHDDHLGTRGLRQRGGGRKPHVFADDHGAANTGDVDTPRSVPGSK